MVDELDGFVPYAPGTSGKPGSNELTGKSGCYIANVKVSGELYVGSTANLAHRVSTNLSKLNQGKHHSRDLQDAYNNNPDVTIWVRTTNTVEEAQQLEQEMVNKLLPSGKLTNAGTDDVTRPRLGATISEEHKQIISETHLGKVLSDETRLKISKAHLGKSRSDEHKQNQSVALKEYFATDEGKAAHAHGTEKRKEPVICKGVTYPSLTEAAKALGVDVSTIARRCNNDNFPDFFKQT